MHDIEKTQTELISEIRRLLKRIEQLEQEAAQQTRSADALRRALSLAPFPIMIYAEDGEVIAINKTWTKITGYTLSDIPTVTAWTRRAHGPLEGPVVQKRIDRLCATPVGHSQEGPSQSEFPSIEITTRAGTQRTWTLAFRRLGVAADGRRLLLATGMDITEQRRAEEALRIKDAAIESSVSGIAMADLDGRLIYVNDAFLRMWHYDHPDEVLGTRLLAFWQDIQQAVKVGEALWIEGTWSGKLAARRPDGTRFVAHLSANMVLNDNNDPICMMASFIDITDREEQERALRQYAADLEARTEELDAFSHTVAHDLRNPLARVVGYAEFLQDTCVEVVRGPASSDAPPLRGEGEGGGSREPSPAGPGSMTLDELREHLGTIARAGRQANRIISELLLLASVRQIQEVELKPLDMGRIVNNVLDRLEFMLADYDPELTVPDHWPAAMGHAPWVEEIWENLLSNALKYGGDPPQVELGAEAPSDGVVRFWVSDNGPGIANEDMSKLFVPFSRLAQLPRPGHGLGLSIVRRVVEKLGGDVAVESTVGVGSRFSFTLPAAE